jgi:hypothetical protein
MEKFKVAVKKIVDCSYEYIIYADSYNEAEEILLSQLKESESNDDMLVEYEINNVTQINK